jgi:hypothetical protein
MIWLAILRRAAPFLVAGGLVLGGWWWHTGKVEAAYKRGKAEVSAAWTASDKLAQAREEAKTAQTRREAAQLEEDFNERLTKANALAAGNAALVVRLRKSLAALSTPSGASAGQAPTATGPGDGERVARVLPILAEGPGLVEEARANFERCAAKLDSLQAWAKLVSAASEAP